MSNQTTRLLSGIVYIFVIFLGTHYIGYDWIQAIFPTVSSKFIYLGLMAILYIFCAWELMKIIDFSSILMKVVSLVIGGIPLFIFGEQLIIGDLWMGINWRKLLLVAPFLVALFTIFKYPKDLDNIDSSKLIFVVCYLGMPFGLSPYLQNFDSNFPSTVFYIFVLIWASDTGAYLAGRKWGKTPMAPTISPKKTWEGLAGGVGLTLVIGVLFELYLPYQKTNWIITALIVSLSAPIGDLAESRIKRTFGVKDSSNLIPGHGGFLDRLDSFICVAPMVYIYFIINYIW